METYAKEQENTQDDKTDQQLDNDAGELNFSIPGLPVPDCNYEQIPNECDYRVRLRRLH